MGWCIIVKADLLPQILNTTAIVLLVFGGIAYTVGALVYGLGKKYKLKFAHSIWHLFVLSGSLLHFFCILLFVM